MKISRLTRRDFIEGMLLIGLSACGGPRSGHRALKASPSGHGSLGPFFTKLSQSSDKLMRGELTSGAFIKDMSARLMELELEEDVLEHWRQVGPDIDGEGDNGYRVIHARELRFGDRPGVAKAVLFYTPRGASNPPHEHHNIVSTKRVLKGSYHVRQYERLRRVEPGLIAIRQVTELPEVTFAGPTVDMTDDQLNVHWFGASQGPVLALNIVAENVLPLAETFHGQNESRGPGRYFVDPTGKADGQGVILARTLDDDAADVFTRRPLSDFPSQMKPT
jgi:hypothetical protein